jgi:hypothetical protein
MESFKEVRWKCSPLLRWTSGIWGGGSMIAKEAMVRAKTRNNSRSVAK